MSKSLRTTTDRFTSLPDDVAHKVVSFLSLEDVSRLSVVSRRCRQLCISMPSLNVDVRPYLQDATKRTRLMNYVERLFSLRRGVTTRRLCIGWFLDSCVNDNGGDEEEYRILSWLHNAVTCNVKWLVLYLGLKRGSAFSLPPCLIHSMSLECLTACVSINSILKFPSYSTIELSSLKTLDLYCVRIDESFGNWVSTCCKFLRNLYLKQIKETKSIAINSSSITKLCITSMDYKLCHLQVSAWILEKMSLWWEFDSANNRTLQLSIPMLRMFVWKGNILRLPLTENLAALKSSASILFRSASTLTSQNLIRFYCDFRNLNHPSPNLFDKHLQELTLTLLRDMTERGCLPILFPSNLALYIFTTSISNDLVQHVESLFEGSSTPYHYLHIRNKVLLSHTEFTEMEACESTKYCDAQIGMTLEQNLKSVTIQLFSQEKNELEMIKYLFKNAKYLQRMTILYTPPLGPDIIGEIRGHEKASGDVAVKFHPI